MNNEIKKNFDLDKDTKIFVERLLFFLLCVIEPATAKNIVRREVSQDCASWSFQALKVESMLDIRARKKNVDVPEFLGTSAEFT